jgi:HPt (histidine-containing phosphotransfer) domain-containing protein
MRESTEQYAEVFDEALALHCVGGDREFLAEVVGLMQAAWPTLLADIQEAMDRQDLRGVETSARLAKAAARYVSARRAHESALQLETVAGKGDLPAAREASARLEQEAEILQLALSTLAIPGQTQ